MSNPFKGRRAVSIRKPVYAMTTTDGVSAELTMYGDIYEQQPTDWWGDPIEGQFITLAEFMEDLEQIAGCKTITIRMNSYGGDAGVSILIHNRLRDMAAKGITLKCVVDGVAMSGGSLIMCACDSVAVNPSSLIMIHKCWSFLFGGYNADELRQQALQNDAYDKAQMSIYTRKCGLSDTVILNMMAKTTYLTGREAVEKGFADEVLNDADPVDIAASADGRSLFVRGRTMHLAPGMFAPDSIPTVRSEVQTRAKTNTHQPAQTGNEGGNTMARNLDDLRTENPELTEALMTEAIQAEQKRIREIDELAGLYDAETVKAAKYGENACTAQEMTYRAAQKAAQQGRKFLADAFADTGESGTGEVGAVPPADDKGSRNTIEQARADAKAFNARKKEGR